MQSTSPVDCNVTLLTVQASSALHGTSCTDSTKLEKAVENGTIITDIVLSLLSHVAVHVIGGNSSEEVDVLVGMELGHLVDNRRLGPVDFEVFVDIVVHHQAVGKSNPVRLHRVASNIGIVANVRVVEISHLLLRRVKLRVEWATSVDACWICHVEGRRCTVGVLGRRGCSNGWIVFWTVFDEEGRDR